MMMLAIVRYVRHLDTTVHALHIKTRLCQLVEAMMKRRDDLAFRQEMRFRNKLVEYLTDWCMGNSHQIAPPAAGDVTAITRHLDEACMHAVAALLQGLPLQSEESDRGDLMEAKSQLFLKYFTLFMNLLNGVVSIFCAVGLAGIYGDEISTASTVFSISFLTFTPMSPNDDMDNVVILAQALILIKLRSTDWCTI